MRSPPPTLVDLVVHTSAHIIGYSLIAAIVLTYPIKFTSTLLELQQRDREAEAERVRLAGLPKHDFQRPPPRDGAHPSPFYQSLERQQAYLLKSSVGTLVGNEKVVKEESLALDDSTEVVSTVIIPAVPIAEQGPPTISLSPSRETDSTTPLDLVDTPATLESSEPLAVEKTGAEFTVETDIASSDKVEVTSENVADSAEDVGVGNTSTKVDVSSEAITKSEKVVALEPEVSVIVTEEEVAEIVAPVSSVEEQDAASLENTTAEKQEVLEKNVGADVETEATNVVVTLNEAVDKPAGVRETAIISEDEVVTVLAEREVEVTSPAVEVSEVAVTELTATTQEINTGLESTTPSEPESEVKNEVAEEEVEPAPVVAVIEKTVQMKKVVKQKKIKVQPRPQPQQAQRASIPIVEDLIAARTPSAAGRSKRLSASSPPRMTAPYSKSSRSGRSRYRSQTPPPSETTESAFFKAFEAKLESPIEGPVDESDIPAVKSEVFPSFKVSEEPSSAAPPSAELVIVENVDAVAEQQSGSTTFGANHDISMEPASEVAIPAPAAPVYDDMDAEATESSEEASPSDLEELPSWDGGNTSVSTSATSLASTTDAMCDVELSPPSNDSPFPSITFPLQQSIPKFDEEMDSIPQPPAAAVDYETMDEDEQQQNFPSQGLLEDAQIAPMDEEVSSPPAFAASTTTQGPSEVFNFAHEVTTTPPTNFSPPTPSSPPAEVTTPLSTPSVQSFDAFTRPFPSPLLNLTSVFESSYQPINVIASTNSYPTSTFNSHVGETSSTSLLNVLGSTPSWVTTMAAKNSALASSKVLQKEMEEEEEDYERRERFDRDDEIRPYEDFYPIDIPVASTSQSAITPSSLVNSSTCQTNLLTNQSSTSSPPKNAGTSLDAYGELEAYLDDEERNARQAEYDEYDSDEYDYSDTDSDSEDEQIERTRIAREQDDEEEEDEEGSEEEEDESDMESDGSGEYDSDYDLWGGGGRRVIDVDENEDLDDEVQSPKPTQPQQPRASTSRQIIVNRTEDYDEVYYANDSDDEDTPPPASEKLPSAPRPIRALPKRLQ